MAYSALHWPDALFCNSFKEKVRRSRVLLVGAGGIGSEVLKTLVLTGFRHISVVDLDTIETSNLNRQFLFRSTHVGQSKAVVAADAVKHFMPMIAESPEIDMHISKKQREDFYDNGTSQTRRRKWAKQGQDLLVRPYHRNINTSEFDVNFFRRFDIVLNGLDNLNARRHVNRMCRASGVSLIESGTTGYEGSVTVHIKDHSHCYECEDKPTQKSFPICTIRNTPEKLVHCVVWAKDLLFTRLFGRQDAVSDLDEQRDQSDGTDNIKPSFFLKKEQEPVDAYAVRIFNRVFDDDIQAVAKMTNLWKEKSPPSPLRWEFDQAMGIGGNDNLYRLLTRQENATLFATSIAMLHQQRRGEIGRLVFDKDDDLAVRFVAAAANLRAMCYSIETGTIFEIKGIAGNIVHAIATTNASVAGLVVIEACKILAGCKRYTKESFVGKHCLLTSAKRKRDILIKSVMPPAKNPNCVACGKSILHLATDTTTFKLDALVAKVIKGRLGVTAPTLASGGFMYEEGEGLDEDERREYESMLSLPLSDLPGGGLHHGAMLTISCQDQHFNCQIAISHAMDMDEDAHPEGFVLAGAVRSSEDGSSSKKPRKKRPITVTGSIRLTKVSWTGLVTEKLPEDAVVTLSVDSGSDDDDVVIVSASKKSRVDTSTSMNA